MNIEGSLNIFWRFFALATSFVYVALCIYGAFYYADAPAMGLELLLKWLVVFGIIISGIMVASFPFKGICAFHYDGLVLTTKNLATGRIRKHNLSEIEKIRSIETKGFRDIVFKDGSYIIVGIWRISNINKLLTQLRKDIKVYKRGTYNFNISPTNQ